MKKITLIILICFTSCTLWAQNDDSTIHVIKKNIIKVNLFSFAIKNVAVQYERVVSKKVSIALGVNYMPDGSIPLQSTFEGLTDDPDTKAQIKNITLGSYSFTPELRWYLGKKGAPQGFYLAPYMRMSSYNISLPFMYDDGTTTKQIPLSGSVNTVTGGLLMGAQWKLGKAVKLDWWIIGPNYGSSNGKIDGKTPLTASEQSALRTELDQLDIPLTKITYTVDNNGATVNFKGPWAGVRSGLCLGFAF